MSVKLGVKLIDGTAKLPTRGSRYAAGYDIYTPYTFSILAHEIKMVGLGIAFNISPEYYIQLYIRSSIAKRGLCILNAVGIIDPDYKNEVKLILYNHTDTTITIESAERFCQLVICSLIQAEIVEITEMTGYDREGGFGSTGKH